MEQQMTSASDYPSAHEGEPAVVRVRSIGLWAFMLVVGECVNVLATGTAAGEDDPLEWRARASKTQFRKLLPDADYERLSATPASRLPQALKEAATKVPDHGLKLSGVFTRSSRHKA